MGSQFNHTTRRCSKCGVHKPISGGTTYPKFMCRECKEARKKDEN
jgi:hypothetical protein